jgi:protein-ribulosamine 3-kinase
VKPPAFLEDALRRALRAPGLEIVGVGAAGGGCIHNAAHVATSAGDAFVKWNHSSPPDLFLREADGLEALLAAGSELAIPRVFLAASPAEAAPGFIVMEYLPPEGRRGDATDEALGRGLAAIHRRRADTFGFDADTYCGSTRQDNTRSASWVEFYRDRRLGLLVRLIADERGLDAAERRPFDLLLDRLPELLPHDPSPSLIHGDLWSGNVLASARGPALFDPACAYADREMEFGITRLFGGFSNRFFSAYDEAWPMAPEWRERVPLYKLYHLLNHHLIFGGHYGVEALAVARRYA